MPRLLKEPPMRTAFFSFALAASQILAVGLASRAAVAADTPEPSRPAVVAAPAKTDRMTTARDAIKRKEWKKSIDELALAVREQPANADAHNLLAYSYRKQASPDLASAFEHYNIALQLNPSHRGAHEYIGEAYLMDKKPVKAEEHLAQLKTICGNTTCEEYEDLAKSIATYKEKNR